MPTRGLRRTGLILFAMSAGLMLVGTLSSCGGKSPAARSQVDVAPQQQRQFELLEQDHLLHRDQEVLARGRQLLAAAPDHPLGDQIAAVMIRSAARLEQLDTVRDLALDFPSRWPRSSRRDRTMSMAAEVLADAGRRDDARLVLARLAAAQPDGMARDLTISRLEGLGDATVAAPATADTMASVHSLDRLGVLCPLTGRYARFGNAFLLGVQLAAGDVPTADPDRPWRLFYEDTEADPVLAALAARRLAVEDSCGVLMGGLLSSTTAAIALVADQAGVSLVSPTATSERLGLLGAHVLQTNQTGPLEAGLLARLTCEVLLKTRFAIIRPDTPEGASMGAAFAAAVAELGGQIVREEIIDPSATDFRTQVRALREVRPEVVFAPTTVDQMVLLGPQLDFYRIGALVLGPSAWNSSRLMERAGSVMERAVFTASELAFPAGWTADFRADWPADEYDEEATSIGRGAYLAARMTLTSLAGDPGVMPADVATHLREELTGGEATGEGPARYATVVRMVDGGRIVPFPGELYTEAWQRELAQALADSLAMADSLRMVADSLGLEAPVTE